MKNALILGVLSATFVMVGCSKEPSTSSPKLSNDGKAVAVSDGTNTWSLGVIRINGTNVSGTNVTIGVRARETSK